LRNRGRCYATKFSCRGRVLLAQTMRLEVGHCWVLLLGLFGQGFGRHFAWSDGPSPTKPTSTSRSTEPLARKLNSVFCPVQDPRASCKQKDPKDFSSRARQVRLSVHLLPAPSGSLPVRLAYILSHGVPGHPLFSVGTGDCKLATAPLPPNTQQH